MSRGSDGEMSIEYEELVGDHNRHHEMSCEHEWEPYDKEKDFPYGWLIFESCVRRNAEKTRSLAIGK